MNEVLIKVIGNYSYQSGHCLGEGVYGKVYEGIEKESKEKVAIKKIDLSSLMNDKYLENAIFSEIYLLKRFDHLNIVKFRDVLSSKNSLYIITEYCKGGDLKEIIKKKRFNQEEAFQVVRQIVNGFSELVAKKVVHRDLKPANILFHEGVFKIADFGFAKYVDNFGGQMLKSCVGSPIYMAPQLLERQSYTTKCDVWSLGVIMFQMLFGITPWRARDENQLIHALKSIPITSILKDGKHPMSPKMHEFISKCLTYSERDRYSWNDLFKIFLPDYSPQQSSIGKLPSPRENISPSKSPTVRMYNPKTHETQILEPLTGKSPSHISQKAQVSSPMLDKNQKASKTNYFSTPYNLEVQDTPVEKVSVLQPYTPRQGPSRAPSVQFPLTPSSSPSIGLMKSPRAMSTETPVKSSYIMQDNPGNFLKEEQLHNEILYRYFACTQLLLCYQSIQSMQVNMFPYQKLLYFLVQLIKLQNGFVRSQMLVAPYCKSTQQLLQRIEAQQKTYEMIEKDVQRLLVSKQTLEKCQEEVRLKCGWILTEIVNEQKLNKMSQLLYDCLKENAYNFLNEKRTRYTNEDQISDVLWLLSDLLIMYGNKTNRLSEVSQRDQTDREGASVEFRIERLLFK